ncbi:MAG: hypothetical protein LBV69_10960 [Bacteroidales bacterium]|jgi:hypothetical protein|nr:hypothetical protein [Bacteroidales bacterium]
MKLDKFISASSKLFLGIFNPLIVISIAIAAFFSSEHFFATNNLPLKNYLIFLYFILSFLLPNILYYTIKWSLPFFRLKISTPKLRNIFCIVTILTTIFVLIMSIKIHLIPLLIEFILSILLIFIFYFIITFFKEISLHILTFSSLLSFFVYMIFFQDINMITLFLISILLIGIISSLQLFLDIHSPKQIFISFIIGFLSTFLILFII